MEEHFYLVPISNDCIFVNDIKLRDLLEQYYFKIYENIMEEEYIIQKLDEEHVFSINEKIDKLYELYKIPKYLIIVEDDGEFKELITKLDINIIDLSEILKYQLDDARKVSEYYFKSNYKDKIINLFRMYGFLNRKGVVKKRLKK